jgi:threonine/homoserine/homoserine lactone efflux protein
LDLFDISRERYWGMTEPLAFILAVLGLLATPGPTNTLLAASGAAVGVRRSLHLIPAEVLGYLCSILVLALVLGPVAQHWPLFGSALRVSCGLWLAFLAWRHWTAAVHGVEPRAVPFAKVFVTTLLNPKGLIFAFAIIPHLAEGNPTAALPYLVGLVALIVAVGTAWIGVGAALVAAGARHRWVQRVSAAVLGVFALIISGSAFSR